MDRVTPQASVSPTDTLNHMERVWKREQGQNLSPAEKNSQTPISFTRARTLSWDSLYRKFLCADGPLILFKASLVFLGLQMALRSAARSEAGASAQRKEPTNSVSNSEGLRRAVAWPAGFADPTAF